MHAREPVEPRPAEHRRRRAQPLGARAEELLVTEWAVEREVVHRATMRRVPRFIAGPRSGLCSSRAAGAASAPGAAGRISRPSSGGRREARAARSPAPRSARRGRSVGAGAAQQRLAHAPLQRFAVACLLLVDPVSGRFGLGSTAPLLLHDAYPIMRRGRLRRQGARLPPTPWPAPTRAASHTRSSDRGPPATAAAPEAPRALGQHHPREPRPTLPRRHFTRGACA